MTEHAKLSASGAKKWLACPASIAMEKGIVGQESSYAAEGTKAHALAEVELGKMLDIIDLAGYTEEKKELGEIDPEMQDAVEFYTTHIAEVYGESRKIDRDTGVAIESRVDFSRWVPEGFGTADCVISCSDCIHVIDLKYGKGVKVEAEENPQLKLYGLGAWNALEPFYEADAKPKIMLHIVQPRLDHVSVWEIALDKLLDWGEKIVKPKADYAFSEPQEPNAFCVGEHCRTGFCAARPICRAYAEYMDGLAFDDFRPVARLTSDEIAERLVRFEKIAAYAKTLQEYALEQAKSGEKFPGWKLVEGVSRRKVTDEKRLAELLISQGFDADTVCPRKIATLSTLEKTVGADTLKKIAGDLIVKPQGAPTLVPATDKRKEIGVDTAKDDFENL